VDTGLHFPRTYALGSVSALTGVGEYSADEDGTLSSYTTDAQNMGSMTICSFDTKKGYATGTFSFVAGQGNQAGGTPVSVAGGTSRLPVDIVKQQYPGPFSRPSSRIQKAVRTARTPPRRACRRE